LAIAHPGVVAIHDVLTTEEQEPILVMELLEGESFRETLDREGRIDIATLSRWLLPAISAIGTAHSLGIVHRDIKPENLYLARAADGSQSLKVLDFGIAKLTANIGPAAKTAVLTGKGIMIGTPLYMAPEQMMCEPGVDHRADIWSLGIVLYEALTGILPTEASSIGKSVSRLLGNITPIEKVAPTLPSDTSRLVGRMLSADPGNRPPDLREVFAALLPYAGGLSCDGFGPASPRSVD
jgi:serine/threonine-protein kinase